MPSDSGIQKDVLFLAITRPTSAWGGVPYEGLVINIAISWLAFFCVANGNVWSIRGVVTLLIFPCLHFAMRLVMSIDHNLFRIMRLYWETHGIQPRRVSVLWAMDYRDAKNARDIASSV